jgi:sRNA-binding protein
MAHVTELRMVLTVQDFDQALAFYRDGWRPESGVNRRARFRLRLSGYVAGVTVMVWLG